MLKNRTKNELLKQNITKKYALFLLPLWVFHCTYVPPKAKCESIHFMPECKYLSKRSSSPYNVMKSHIDWIFCFVQILNDIERCFSLNLG